jgi:hypothetical protein
MTRAGHPYLETTDDRAGHPYQQKAAQVGGLLRRTTGPVVPTLYFAEAL